MATPEKSFTKQMLMKYLFRELWVGAQMEVEVRVEVEGLLEVWRA